MTVTRKKAKGQKTGLRGGAARRRIAGVRGTLSRRGRIAGLRASVEDEVLRLVEENVEVESRWNRPRKQRLSLRVDCEVVDWFKSKGPGYQTRINRILRRVMVEGKRSMGEK